MISKNTIKLIRSLELKKNRIREGLFVAEGPKVVADLMAKSAPRLIIATEKWWRTFGREPRQHDAVADDDELRRLSFLQHPQQVLALFPLPCSDNCVETWRNELCIALDAIQDPGNLGTIIRVADWFGIKTIFCGTGTADAYSPKTIQATMGSIARVRLIHTELHALLDSLPAEIPVYATALNGTDIYSAELSANGIIIMGNEGSGVSTEVMSRVNRRLFIPCYQREREIDSLNVAIATAIACAEFRRRL